MVPLNGGTIPRDALRERTLIVAERLKRHLEPGESALHASEPALDTFQPALYTSEAFLYSREVLAYLPELLAEEVNQLTVLVA